MKKIDFSKPVLLQSVVNPKLVVLNIPTTKEDKDQFKGIILTVEESISGNKSFDASNSYRKSKFQIFEGSIRVE